MRAVDDGTTEPRAPRSDMRDIYYRESASDFAEVFGANWQARLHELALLVFTPDAIATAQVAAGWRLLTDAGFIAVTARPVRVTRHVCRAIWRRELFEMSLDRLAVAERLLSLSDSVAVLLTRLDPDSHPASQRLSALKGSGEPACRETGSLRASLNSPNSVYRLVHASDGPTELVRELGILFDCHERIELLKETRQRFPIACAALESLADDARNSPKLRSFHTGESLDRIRGSVRAALRTSPSEPELLAFASQLTILALGGKVPCRLLYETAQATRLIFDQWDLVAIGARSECAT